MSGREAWRRRLCPSCPQPCPLRRVSSLLLLRPRVPASRCCPQPQTAPRHLGNASGPAWSRCSAGRVQRPEGAASGWLVSAARTGRPAVFSLSFAEAVLGICCGARALLLQGTGRERAGVGSCGAWRPPRPGTGLASPALAGGSQPLSHQGSPGLSFLKSSPDPSCKGSGTEPGEWGLGPGACLFLSDVWPQPRSPACPPPGPARPGAPLQGPALTSALSAVCPSPVGAL